MASGLYGETFGLLLLASLLAGFVDAVAGGGGLIQVPALFTALPGQPPASLFGTNKLASIFGTGNAALRFARRVALPWEVAVPAALAAFVAAFGGAAAVAWLPREWVRPLVFVLLLAVIAYSATRHDFGLSAGPRRAARVERWLAVGWGAVLGFYDGIFGPGTGSFLIFVFVRVFRFDFLRASAVAKVVNFSTNAAALSYFVPAGHVVWAVALGMAVANVLGAQLGARLALQRGAGFVRGVFLLMASLLAARFGLDTGRQLGWW